MIKKSLLKEVKKLEKLNSKIVEAEKGLGRICVSDIENILRNNLGDAYRNIEVVGNIGDSCWDRGVIPKLYIYDTLKEEFILYEIDLLHSQASLNKDYKRKILGKNYDGQIKPKNIESINQSLETLGYILTKESFSRRHKGGAGHPK